MPPTPSSAASMVLSSRTRCGDSIVIGTQMMHTPLVAVRVDIKKGIIIICFLKDEYSYVVIILLVIVVQQQNKQSFWLSHTTNISGGGQLAKVSQILESRHGLWIIPAEGLVPRLQWLVA